MSLPVDQGKNVFSRLAAVGINLHYGASAIGSLQCITSAGLAYMEIAAAKRAGEYSALPCPTKQQKSDYELSRMFHKITTESARPALEAAAIVYAHAVLDDAIHKLCKLTAEQDPNSWISLIEKRQVTFQDLILTGKDCVQQKLIDNYLNQLERESLIAKCDTLFKVAKPKSVRGLLRGYRYSRERLKLLDGLRHDIIHKQSFHKRTKQVSAKVDYLIRTGQFFLNMLADVYNVPKLRDPENLPESQKINEVIRRCVPVPKISDHPDLFAEGIPPDSKV